MLKMSGQGTNKKTGKPVQLVILGLSHTNLDRLKKGQPIMFPGEDVHLPGVEVIIFSGKDEDVMQRSFEELVGPGTITTVTHTAPRSRQ